MLSAKRRPLLAIIFLGALASLRPSADVRRALYSGTVAAALLKGLDVITPWLRAAIERLTYIR
jgi:hypothetical protein